MLIKHSFNFFTFIISVINLTCLILMHHILHPANSCVQKENNYDMLCLSFLCIQNMMRNIPLFSKGGARINPNLEFLVELFVFNDMDVFSVCSVALLNRFFAQTKASFIHVKQIFTTSTC